MRRYSDLEIDLLIDDISEIAIEAIEQAAGEAAKAAALAMLEREAAALREVTRWRQEAERLSQEITQTKKAGIRNVVVTGLLCLVSGFAVGAIIR